MLFTYLLGRRSHLLNHLVLYLLNLLTRGEGLVPVVVTEGWQLCCEARSDYNRGLSPTRRVTKYDDAANLVSTLLHIFCISEPLILRQIQEHLLLSEFMRPAADDSSGQVSRSEHWRLNQQAKVFLNYDQLYLNRIDL
jgi:hypothetical protein